ncbi:MAG: hypothetical protein AB7O57_12175 [Hyphomicrobiaceae bacterium]
MGLVFRLLLSFVGIVAAAAGAAWLHVAGVPEVLPKPVAAPKVAEERLVASLTGPAAEADPRPANSEVRAATPPHGKSGREAAPAGLKIDVARIDPDGASVLAGEAPPNSRVTILAGGRPIGEATASDAGQWSAVVVHTFAAGPVDLQIKSDAVATLGAVSPSVTVVVPVRSGTPGLAVATAGPRPILPGRVAAVAPARAPATTADAALGLATATAASGKGAGDAARPTSGPVPITFVSGEATMTSDGIRAADALVAYVRRIQPTSLTLTGHADVRGDDAFNLELSRRRLEAIERHLRANGYQGQLSLLPKGRSEPYLAIDRKALPLDAVYQADRRVELRSGR